MACWGVAGLAGKGADREGRRAVAMERGQARAGGRAGGRGGEGSARATGASCRCLRACAALSETDVRHELWTVRAGTQVALMPSVAFRSPSLPSPTYSDATSGPLTIDDTHIALPRTEVMTSSPTYVLRHDVGPVDDKHRRAGVGRGRARQHGLAAARGPVQQDATRRANPGRELRVCVWGGWRGVGLSSCCRRGGQPSLRSGGRWEGMGPVRQQPPTNQLTPHDMTRVHALNTHSLCVCGWADKQGSLRA